MDGTRTPLTEVVKAVSDFLVHNPEIAAVHIVDSHPVDAFDRWWAESLVESAELHLAHPRPGSWSVTRKAEHEDLSPPLNRGRAKLIRKLHTISHWSAGFDGLAEGAR